MMPRCLVFALGLAASGLAPVLAAAQIPAACPSVPTTVTRSRGGQIEYRGTMPNVPDICRQVRADGPGDYYFGVWRIDWPGAGQAYPAIKNVALGAPGARISFVTYSAPGLQFVDSIINEGIEPMVVDGTTYQTLKLAHERKGFGGNTYHSIITIWRDVKTGVALRTLEQQISGKSYGPDTTWEAVRVQTQPR